MSKATRSYRVYSHHCACGFVASAASHARLAYAFDAHPVTRNCRNLARSIKTVTVPLVSKYIIPAAVIRAL
jgi:hypothetical protein